MNTIEQNNQIIGKFMGEDPKNLFAYHANWDLLIPVIVKCRENQIFGAQRLISNIDKGLIELDLIRTYRNAFDFIEWFNAQSK